MVEQSEQDQKEIEFLRQVVTDQAKLIEFQADAIEKMKGILSKWGENPDDYPQEGGKDE